MEVARARDATLSRACFYEKVERHLVRDIDDVVDSRICKLRVMAC